MDGFRNRGKTKTKHGVRIVPLLEPLLSILRDWRRVCPREGRIGSRFPTSEANALRIARVLDLNPWMSDLQVARLLHVGPHTVQIVRKAMGLPPFRKGTKAHLRQTVVMPLAVPDQDAASPLSVPEDRGRLGNVFPTRNGRDLQHNTIWIRIREIQLALDIIERDADDNPVFAQDDRPNAKYGPHAFRHFFVSFLSQLKHPDGSRFKLEEVAKIVGHSDVTMTKHYSHLSPDAEQDKKNRKTMSAGFLRLLHIGEVEASTKVVKLSTKTS
jgi:integrase